MGGLGNIARLFNSQEHNYSEYSFSKANYYANLKYPRNLDDLIACYKEENNKEKLESNSIIQFNRHPFGSTLEEVIHVAGKPRFMTENTYDNTLIHTTCFYKNKVGKHQAISQLHFIEDSFYWGVYLFLNKLSKEQRNDLKKVLALKYAIPFNEHESRNIVIGDSQDNKIALNNEIYTTLNYISGNSKLRNLIVQKLQNHHNLTRIMGGQEQKNLLDML